MTAQGNAVLVDALGSALRRGGNALSTVPDLLKRVLEEGSWREFVTQRGELVRHERFAEFVTTPPLRGIGADVALVRRIVDDDTKASALLEQALQNPTGRPKTVDNIHNKRPTGTSKEQALRRLREDAPELHAEVMAGNLTAHAAMVQAGYRPVTFTVRAGSAESIAATLRRRLSAEQLSELARLLSEG